MVPLTDNARPFAAADALMDWPVVKTFAADSNAMLDDEVIDVPPPMTSDSPDSALENVPVVPTMEVAAMGPESIPPVQVPTCVQPTRTDPAAVEVVRSVVPTSGAGWADATEAMNKNRTLSRADNAGSSQKS